MIQSSIPCVALLVAATAASGCDGAPDDPSPASAASGEAASPLASFRERLLDEADRGGVHVRLYEIAPGRIAVSQERELGVEPFFAKEEVETWDAELLYRRLNPHVGEVPSAVKEVALHRQQLGAPGRAAPADAESVPQQMGTPPNPVPAASGQHLLYDFAADDAAWFKANYCDIGSRGWASVNAQGGPGGYDTWCWTNVGGAGWLQRGNQYDAHVSLMSASSTATAEMKFHAVWDCGFLWYVECDGTAHDDTVQPRHILTWSTNTGFYSWGNGPWYHHGGYYGARSKAGSGLGGGG